MPRCSHTRNRPAGSVPRLRRCRNGRHRDPRHRARGVPRRQRRGERGTDAGADRRRGLGQAGPRRVVGGLRLAVGVGRRPLCRPRRRLPVRHARPRRRVVAHERRHAGRRAQHAPPPGCDARVDRSPARRGGRPRPGARQPAGERDAHLSTLRLRTRRTQRRGDDHVPRRACRSAGRRLAGRCACSIRTRSDRPATAIYDRVARRPGVLRRPRVDVAALSREGHRARRRRRVRRRAHAPPTGSTTGSCTTA